MFKNDWKYSINSKVFDDIDPLLFLNHRFKTIIKYILSMWLMNLLQLALFISDIYTCIKLLAFNSWSNNLIKPYVSFKVSKWIFSGCILGSIALLLWEIICGIGIYRTRNISLTFVNNFSRNVYSMTEYPKFCIYDKISSKGAFQKIAFFTFFELKDCMRLLLTDTPRQVINGLTLWSALVTVHANADLGDLESFSGLINKLQRIAETNHQEAVILSFMLFSFIVWAFFMARLIVAMFCAFFVYFRLIKEQEYNGLKEYVCITVSRHVDELTETETRKKMGQDIYRTSLLAPSTSLLELELSDLERNPLSSVSNTAYASYNDSSMSLSNTQTNIKKHEKIVTNEFNYDSEHDFTPATAPIPIGSTLNNTFGGYHNNPSIEVPGLSGSNVYYNKSPQGSNAELYRNQAINNHKIRPTPIDQNVTLDSGPNSEVYMLKQSQHRHFNNDELEEPDEYNSQAIVTEEPSIIGYKNY
ncbi:Kch1p NDAI_0B01170 [Naumovozyma dairenensis CBS 421]|uniref:Uncharacterized protein n=1 Tax=Naumovozyma dairenensis (strain ATCC 10597 / BCRC 20456 / CBS 421 / NBRC 0211 / NRRL Y-12639) TaxID=1071378 RepID=G0W5U0_NAUDC|nr:hypothetical protein NDAI_0B01170 [Naumovozyma dairenensis CBS 421]CCD23151.1 hypothetical protein NDAI_0B01170 [Naumovozyma dairenensis CBS 421]